MQNLRQDVSGQKIPKIKNMSLKKKYDRVRKNVELDFQYIPSFVKINLGRDAVEKLRNKWQEGLRNIPEDMPVEQKYERAYDNWVWIATNTYNFIREQLGENGIAKFERAEINFLKKQYSGFQMNIFRAGRKIAPGFVSGLVIKQLLFELQWMTPIALSELSARRFVVRLPRCKVMNTHGTDDLCRIGCQNTYAIWIAEQFSLSVRTFYEENGCSKIITPL